MTALHWKAHTVCASGCDQEGHADSLSGTPSAELLLCSLEWISLFGLTLALGLTEPQILAMALELTHKHPTSDRIDYTVSTSNKGCTFWENFAE